MASALPTWSGGHVTAAVLSAYFSKTTQTLLLETAATLRSRRVASSSSVAPLTLMTLRRVVATAKFSTASQLILLIQIAGRWLQQAQPAEPCIGTMTLKLLQQLRDEFISLRLSLEQDPIERTPRGLLVPLSRTEPSKPEETPAEQQPSVVKNELGPLASNLLADPLSESESEEEQPVRGLAHQVKPIVAEMIQEMLDELELTTSQLGKVARQQVHSGFVLSPFFLTFH